MSDHQSLHALSSDGSVAPASYLSEVLAQTIFHDPVESAVGYGRWWLDQKTSQLILSVVAAEYLDIAPGAQASMESCLTHLVPEDMLVIITALAQAKISNSKIDCEVRVISGSKGLRWLRMQSLPPAAQTQEIEAGFLIDITSHKHATIRERLNFEVSQFLVGMRQKDDAITKVIQLVCEYLGWEWGAYWSIDHRPLGEDRLTCKHYWGFSEEALAAFTEESRTLHMMPGEGLVGSVWSSGQAAWIDDIGNNANCTRRNSVLECGLQSGYAFPVIYQAADGQTRKLGVLEFISSLARQQEAQLPNLSAAIGTLIAQTVQRLEQEEYVRSLAQTDDLTGLSNRNHFYHLLDLACIRSRKSSEQFGLLYIDLDRFKPINDAFGHHAGNVVLQAFAKRLQKIIPDNCHFGRIGGDEFAILMPISNSIVQLHALAEKILSAARTPIQFEGNELTVSASIGISISAENGWTAEELLRSADAAMYRSKKNGRNALSFFSGKGTEMFAAQQSSLIQLLTIEAELHRALIEDEFFLEYQPVIENKSGRMTAVEALIRWRKPDGEIVRPDIFIPIAEKSRLIVQIGRWVVKKVCHDLPMFHRAGLVDLKVHVNMAAVEFTNISLPYELMAVIDACGVAPHYLCLELTEGTVMKQPETVIPVMQLLRQLGFQISLDDFGLGHSSLSRLKKLPINSVKIDRSFVGGLPHDRGDSAIVRTILDLGRHMKLDVIAEGVETDAQLAYLGQFGCPLVQGYLLSRPLAMHDLIAQFRRNHVAVV
ncbi:MAG: EAL domain-containing protein [Burkholderiaceae bacterium]